MSTGYPEPVSYPFALPDGLELADEYTAARAASGLVRVRLPYGEDSWLATRYADARLVLGDRRFGRARRPSTGIRRGRGRGTDGPAC